jgi:CheY-like chemotaxis protein
MKKKLKFDRVILVDDDPITNLIHERLFTVIEKKLPVHVFTDALAALDFLKGISGNGKTLLLVDLNMPVTNGWDFLESFRQLEKSTKEKVEILMVTSSVIQADREKAMTYPEVSGYFIKPICRLTLELKIMVTKKVKVISTDFQDRQ